MSDDSDSVYVYWLVDNGQLQETSVAYAETDGKGRPVWLEPIYGKNALEVSPLLMDVEAAYKAGDVAQVMRYLNARKPALHVSIIESELNLADTAQHLRRFIFIVDPEGKQFTLRFADCVVLETLAVLLTPTQWATMRGPIVRWGVHDRSGSIVQLLSSEERAQMLTPFILSRQQLLELDEASEPDHAIAKVKMLRQGKSLPGNALEQHAWARNARQMWRSQNNSSPLILERLTEAALVTRGKILQASQVKHLLGIINVKDFHEKLSEIAHQMEGRLEE